MIFSKIVRIFPKYRPLKVKNSQQMNLFFPLKTERVPVANQQCGLHSGLTVICLFIQDNKGSL